jgi:serine phosphatase RsbU (regulator of sigma subunit)
MMTFSAKCKLLFSSELFGQAPSWFHRRKMKTTLLCLFLILFTNSVFAGFREDSISVHNYLQEAALHRYKDTKRSIRVAYQANQISERIDYKSGLARSSYELAKAYYLLDDYTSSLEHVMNCLAIVESSSDSVLQSDAYIALANIYIMQNNAIQAQFYLNKSLVIKKQLKDQIAEANIYNNVGYSYYRVHQYDSSMFYYRKALAHSLSIGYKRGQCNTMQNIGHIYNDKGMVDSAEYYYKASLPISTELHDLQITAKNYLKIAEINLNQNRLDETKLNLEKGLPFAKEIGLCQLLCDYYKTSSLLYEKLNKPDEAYRFSKLYYLSVDSFNQAEVSKRVGEMQFNFEMKKKNHEQELKNSAHEASISRRNLIVVAVITLLLFVLIALVAIYKNYRTKKRDNLLLAEKNQIIEEQKKYVEEKNKDITDSINYAKRIQLALLKDKQIQGHLPEHFIFYQPKDIVAGDFYWSMERDGFLYFAAADCTGHGVPGALLSMLGVSFLNEICSGNELLTTAQVLDKLRARFIQELSQTGGSEDSKDGMDISICRLNLNTWQINWSGANNPLWIVSHMDTEVFTTQNKSVSSGKINSLGEEGKHLFEIKADKQPIGYSPHPAPFTDHQIDLMKGDVFYLFTDGFADQFGGPEGKKFMYKKFKNTLLSISDDTTDQQQDKLETIFRDWKGNLEQVDDVCIIGVRVG